MPEDSSWLESQVPVQIFDLVSECHACERRGPRWYLCDYHEGMCDGFWMGLDDERI